jgi:hypothetical protein
LQPGFIETIRAGLKTIERFGVGVANKTQAQPQPPHNSATSPLGDPYLSATHIRARFKSTAACGAGEVNITVNSATAPQTRKERQNSSTPVIGLSLPQATHIHAR